AGSLSGFCLQSIQNQPFCIFAPGASFGPSKLWEPAKWVELGFKIQKELNVLPLIIGSPEENTLLEQLRKKSHGLFITTKNLPMNLGLLKSLIAKSQFVISTDAGPRHIAAAFDKPTVVLMGPNHPSLSDTHHAKTKIIHKFLSCSPCHKKTCPLKHHQCMKEISVSDVINDISYVQSL
ncbi:MAG: glycosyltransferase family 9 protein, partial [Deltaproteobacteria bacterium]|nr:glycosyltransferase family 9 protein [Deltaproteobacteria bacterium]